MQIDSSFNSRWFYIIFRAYGFVLAGEEYETGSHDALASGSSQMRRGSVTDGTNICYKRHKLPKLK